MVAMKTSTNMYGACVSRMALLIERALVASRTDRYDRLAGVPDHVTVSFHAGVILPLPEEVDGVPVHLGTVKRCHPDYFMVDVYDASGRCIANEYLQTHEITMLLS